MYIGFIVIFLLLLALLFLYNNISLLTQNTEKFAPFKSGFIDLYPMQFTWNNPTRFTRNMSYDIRGDILPFYYFVGPWNNSSLF